MKTRTSKFVGFLLAVWAAAPRASAQIPPSLGLQFSAGHPALSLTGAVGTVYSIQYAPYLSPTNSWVDRALLQVQSAGNLWTDPSAPTPGPRFYDMIGNLYEWCQDWYREVYPAGSVTDPQGPVTGSVRVLRGGFWYLQAIYCRSAYRDWDPPNEGHD